MHCYVLDFVFAYFRDLHRSEFRISAGQPVYEHDLRFGEHREFQFFDRRDFDCQYSRDVGRYIGLDTGRDRAGLR
jgi:hypothetical protein